MYTHIVCEYTIQIDVFFSQSALFAKKTYLRIEQSENITNFVNYGYTATL